MDNPVYNALVLAGFFTDLLLKRNWLNQPKRFLVNTKCDNVYKFLRSGSKEIEHITKSASLSVILRN